MDKSIDFLAGLGGGATGVLISHPVDTLRIRYQLAIPLLSSKNPLQLYKGVTPPLLGVGLEKFLVFGNYELIKSYKLFDNYTFLKNHNNFMSGMLSGFLCTLVVTPTEYFKINRQIGKKMSELNWRYMYRGWCSTLIREIPGYGIYFGAYEYLKNVESYPIFNSENSHSKILKSFLCGGIAGASAWAVIYPSDVIKTRMQQNISVSKKMRSHIRDIYREGGIPLFYRGFWLTNSRAFILHAGVFAGYEFFSSLLK